MNLLEDPMTTRTLLLACTVSLLLLSSCSDDPLTPETVAENIRFVTISPGSLEVPAEDGATSGYTLTVDQTYEISTYEITQQEFLSLAGVNPSWHTGGIYPEWRNQPVEHVTWYDAVYFCNKLSEVKGLEPAYQIDYLEGNLEVGYYEGSVRINPNANGYRLPTTQEWEYACRAGTTTQFYTGDLTGSGNDCTTPEPVAERAGWYCTNSRSSKLPSGAPKQVGQKEPNSFGLYDTHGNVWEWCQETNTVKGGSYANTPYDSRAASTVANAWKSTCDGGSRYFNVGFRVVRTVK